MRESLLAQNIQKLPGVFWVRIENKLAGGLPDAIGTFYGHTFFAEFKSLDRYSEKLGATKEQLLWHRRWNRHGGVALFMMKAREEFLCVRHSDGGNSILACGKALKPVFGKQSLLRMLYLASLR